MHVPSRASILFYRLPKEQPQIRVDRGQRVDDLMTAAVALHVSQRTMDRTRLLMLRHRIDSLPLVVPCSQEALKCEGLDLPNEMAAAALRRGLDGWCSVLRDNFTSIDGVEHREGSKRGAPFQVQRTMQSSSESKKEQPLSGFLDLDTRLDSLGYIA